mgnify:CR=1 FL=1
MGETGALEFIKQFGILILVGVVGMGVLIYGMGGELVSEKAVVEIVKNNPARSDLAGYLAISDLNQSTLGMLLGSIP